MAEQTLPPEPPLTKERFSTADQTIALQTRLLLGTEALSPAKRDLPKIKPEQLTEIAIETYSKLRNASTNERDNYWQEKARENESAKNYDQQMTSWVEGVVRYVNNPQGQQRKQTLTRLKFDVNWQEFNQAEAKKLYQRYFGAADTASNVTKFVEDVLASYTENEKINFEKINQDLPEIKKLTNIFGKNSGELLEALIQAQTKLAIPEKKQELIDQANESKTIDNSPTLRVNWLNADEERLLRWLSNNSHEFPSVDVLDVDPVVSYENNRKWADQYIAILRDPKRLKPNPDFPDMLIHDYGFVFDKQNGGVCLDTDLVARRYHLPVAIYTNYLIPNLPHANLVLRGPRLDLQDNCWKILIYDPYQLDMREVVLDEVKTQEDALNAQKTKISYNHLWKQEYLENKEDISLTNDPELKTYQNILINAKLAPFQNDMINCLPYCYMVASMLNALKPGQTDFKTKGMPQFDKDFYLQLLDREEILRRLRKSD